jgi:uncharacterized protein YchJ
VDSWRARHCVFVQFQEAFVATTWLPEQAVLDEIAAVRYAVDIDYWTAAAVICADGL